MAKVFFVITVVALVMVAAVLWQAGKYREFARAALVTTGTVVKKEERTFQNNRETGKENWAQYQFKADGQDVAGEEKIEYPDLWHTLTPGQEVKIYYNKQNPHVNHLATVIDRRIELASGIVRAKAE